MSADVICRKIADYPKYHTVLKMVLESALIFVIVIVIMVGVGIPSSFALTDYEKLLHNLKDKSNFKNPVAFPELPEGHVPVLDDRIVFVQHNGYPLLQDSLEWHGALDAIYGDIVNISEDSLYYIILRANVYKEGELMENIGYSPQWAWRYDYPEEKRSATPDLAESPVKAAMKPGESSFFEFWPGQKGWDCYEVWAESYELERKFKGISDERLRKDIEITSMDIEKGVLKGKIFNPTDVFMNVTNVIVAKYDEGGNMLGLMNDLPGPIGPNKSAKFQIPLYIEGLPIKNQGDNFWYSVPANIEVTAWGISEWDQWNEDDYEFFGHPVQFSGESNFYPDKDTAFYIDVSEIKEKSSERVTSSCLNDPDQHFQQSDYRSAIPEWVKNNAGWWAEDLITEDDFLQGVKYLVENEIIRTDLEREKLKMEINKDKFYVGRYHEDTAIISGWYEESFQVWVTCDMSKPGQVYNDELTLLRSYSDYSFETILQINQNWKEGTYNLTCEHIENDNHKHLKSFSFDVIHGEEPEIEEIVVLKVPTWIKNNAGWWAEGMITEDDFLQGVKYLVENRILDVPRWS